MSAWLTVYCAQTVQHVTPNDILAGIDDVDWHTVAEGFGIEDDAVVDHAIDQLRIGPASNGLGEKFYIRYRDPQFRSVLIHLWVDPDRVRVERDEALEVLERRRGKGAKEVRTHLDRVLEVVAFELKLRDLEGMGIVLAVLVAEYFAGTGDGVIRDQNDEWWILKNHVPVQLVGPKRHA
jgi:hypothetical protein